MEIRTDKFREKGFTLLELLLVLSIVSILILLIIPFGDRWIREQSEDEAIAVFISSVHQMQAYSIANEAHTTIKFRNSGKSYSLYAPNTTEIATIDFPPSMRFVSSSSLNEVAFHPNGHILKTGSIVFRTSRGDVRLAFQLEHGRVIKHDQ
ncbi:MULTISPECIES: competence type IV pilus minor pilin ComGD [Sporosarcina]|uniref:Competence type IV pilus minor pilin ComGD n=1 Tax=Sporosarcina contaminans TaxID=633403 RepID=A0ABW3U038_9BACL